MSVLRQLGRKQTVIHTLSALAACAVTACVMTGCTPYHLLIRAQQWLASRQVPQDDKEPDGEPWPAAGFPGPPKSRPLSTIAELLTWRPPADSLSSPADNPQQQHAVATLSGSQLPAHIFQHTQDPCSSEVPLVLSHTATAHVGSGNSSAAGHTAQQRPQLLVCHDMMGGYLPQDALLSGADDYRHYRLWHWDCIDVFTYFSHHMVTIPPKGWIHAAHKHGVKVLGTFITEFGQGRQRCNKLFASCQAAEAVADQLVAVAAHYGFEGWLVNIENSLSREQVEVMKHFVGYLRARMTATVQHSMVIWYDAVTTAGELRWQNKLSNLNEPFFDLADALFVNYTWTPDTLADTITAAARRQADIYMGVDVHGRGSYGGGGHNVSVALQAAAAAGLSAALFAPGWVYENLDKAKFIQLQEQWWTKVQSDWVYSHPVLHSLPFTTSFNAGAGRGWFRDGCLVAAGAAAVTLQAASVARQIGAAVAGCDGQQQQQHQQQLGDVERQAGEAADAVRPVNGWFNMVLSDTLPTLRDPITQQVIKGPVLARLTSCTAFNGGSCLVLCSQQAVTADGVSGQKAAAAVRASLPEPSAAATTGGVDPGPSTSMLQLFSAHVPVPYDLQLSVSWVYAAPAAASSSSSPADQQQRQQQQIAPPLLWVMTQQGTNTTRNVTASGQKAIHMLDASAEPSQQQQGLQPGVMVEAVPGTQQQVQQQDALGPLQFVGNAASSNSNVLIDGGTDSPTTYSLWDVDLSSALRGCEWRRCSVQLPVRAGSIITGVGVALEAAMVLGIALKEVQVHALLGQLHLTVG